MYYLASYQNKANLVHLQVRACFTEHDVLCLKTENNEDELTWMADIKKRDFLSVVEENRVVF